MTDVYALAARLADYERRLAAVERTAQAPRTTVEGGTFSVVDPDGNPIFLVSEDEEAGGYVAQAANGATLVASDLDLPGGTITETDISDEAISTPKLTANAVTADKIAAGAITADKIAANAVTADAIEAGAIDGQEITGATITGGLFRTSGTADEFLEIGEAVTYNGHAGIRWNTGLGTWAEPSIIGSENPSGGNPGQHVLELSGGAGGGRTATVTLSDWRPSVEVQTADTSAGTSTRVVVSPDSGVEVQANLSVTGSATVGGRNVVTGPGRVYWFTGTLTTNASGIATITHAAGFTPQAIALSQNGATGSSGVNLLYVTGTATATSFQVKATLNGSPFASGSVGFAAFLGG
ncbi:hypothetical protein ACGFI9_20805 [Micromonospora sp. NPDC048930]|uniref:hypothetical protein n=1 Tax=Micromonospora sp. NPDC048930 TaxID=3364261 RepID=UPI00370F821C